MQQIYRGTPMSKCDFNKVPEHLFQGTPLGGWFCTPLIPRFVSGEDIKELFSRQTLTSKSQK